MNRKRSFVTSLTVLVFSLFVCHSCYYDNEEELYGAPDCEFSQVSYNESVLPLLRLFCYECHDNDTRLGGITLEGYDEVAPFVENGSLIGTIKHLSGFSPMPQDQSKIPECDIRLFEQWIEEGASDN